MEIHEFKQGAVTVIKPAGTLTADDSDRLKGALSKRGRGESRPRHPRCIGRAIRGQPGIEALLDVCDELGQCGRAFKLCGTTPTVRERWI